MFSAAPAPIVHPPLEAHGAIQVALIDSSLPKSTVLQQALNHGTRTFVYNSQTESADEVLNRVTSWAQESGTSIRSLSILSRGTAGKFALGNELISSSNLNETSSAWQDLSHVLARGSSINLFGSNLADSLGTGRTLMTELSSMTGARVFASTDTTGFGGNWRLEASTGSRSAWKSPFSQHDLVHWDDTLSIDTPAQQTNAPAQIVLVDTKLADVSTLEKAVLPGNMVFEYDGSAESADEVLSRLIDWSKANATQIQSISILSHGSAGGFELGNQWVTTSTLNQTSLEWQELGTHMVAGASIDLYACDVAAAGGSGQILINDLSQLTGARVFASTDLTGKGGDWILEAQSSNGSVALDSDATSPFDLKLLSNYSGTLGNPSMTTTGTTLAYTENDAATVVDPGLTVNASPNNLSSATVTISANYVNGEDTLGWTNQFGITGSWNATTGVLTLSGSPTGTNDVDYQAILRSVTYVNSSDNPSTSTRTISFQVTGSGGTSTAKTRNISITAVNDAPTLSSIEGSALAYTENDAATAVSSTIVPADVDNANLASATVQITGNYQSSEDLLSFTNANGITGSWNSGTGTMTLTGSATIANYQAALRSVLYTNSSDSPNTSARTVTFIINDGALNSSSVTRNINITAVNDAPTITNGATVTLTGTDEDTTSSGTLVSSILTTVSWADADSGAVKGIAVTSTSANGTWQYSTDGTTWAAFGSVSSTNSLLLTSTTQVRYVPDGRNGETATFAFKAWDQTTGTASTNSTPGYASTASSGGITAFSSNSSTGSITVTSVNDAPTITNGATATLTSTDEDTTSGGTTVSTILTGVSWADVDTGASKGIAVTSKSGNGTWQYSTDGTTWAAFGSVSATNALLLTSGTQVRYIPDSQNGETATFGFKAWDQTTGTASTNGTPSYANPGSGGTTTAYSSNSATASMTITSVNDAPTITNGATVTLTGTDEDTTSSGTTVSSILTTASWADVDTGAVKGIAVTSKTGNGTWQYSTDGTTWAAFGAVSSTNALLLTSTTQVRYIPDGNNGETATFVFKAWDQTTGTASTNSTPGYATTASSGGTTAYSTNSSTASITVTSVNDAPTLTNGATVTLTGTDEDTTSSGTTVSTILSGASYADVDTGASSGIAVTSKSGNGTWQYSTDGTTWTAFGAVSSSSALLLTSTTQVRYIPDGNNGETATFGFKAWDQTTGTASTNGSPSTANPGSGGTTTAYSSNSATASMTVTSVNDAPTITNGATVTLTGTDEDTTSSGTTVSSILTTASWADVDTGASKGIAVTSKTGNGTWQYSTDGTTWAAFGAVSSTNALLLTSTTQVRYIPDSQNGETATFGFKAWDQTSGTASTNSTPGYATTASSGGTTAFSSNSASASMTITSVNDAPTISNGATVTLTGTDEDTTSGGTTVASILTTASWADVDTGASKGIAVTSKSGNGTWQYSTDGVTWAAFGAVSSTNALLLTSGSQVRYVPDGLNGETATFGFKAWDQTSGTASTNSTPGYATTASSGGTTAFSSNSASASMTITSVNDAPTISNGATVTLTGTDEDTTSSGTTVSTILTGASYADSDTGASSGIAITGKTGNGTWQYSTDGTTWTAFGTVSSSSALLLTSTTQVRYIPDAHNGETATFTFVAWDQTTGTASTNGSPSTANPGSGGTTTAYSSSSATASMTITSVNDAPTITNGATATLTGTDEDTTSSGTTVSTILTAASWADVDTGAVKGIAVTAKTGNGTWQYSTDGTTWTAFGTVSSSSALLLDSGTQVRYIPDGNNGETATFTFKAWDKTTGSASTNGSPSTANPGSGGGTTAYSSNSASASMTVTSVNDAPTITNAAVVPLTSTDENTASNAFGANTTVGIAGWADVDTGATMGIAITGKTGNGTWQFSTDNVTWTAIGAVSSSNALLLAPSSYYRYVPDSQNGETATISFVAWDGTTGTASTNGSASYADPGAGGGTTAYSSQSASASITVTSVNDAPTITNGATVTLTGTDEDTTSSGTTVSSILTTASWADVDTGASKGIAVTSKTGNGTWQYSTDGTTWTAFGSVSSSSALLLTSTTQVSYIPDGNNGETATFAFKAWDQTTGAASTNGSPSTANPGAGGGSTAYSTSSATASMTITSVNDAPTISNGATVTLTGTDEDTTSSGTTVSTILTGASWADVDTGASKGIAVTSTTGNGTWQYSTDGSTWTAFGSVSSSNALLLASGTQVRYIPDGQNAETATFGFVAWDQTSDSASANGAASYADPGSGGTTTAYSTQSATASITVTAVNDAPTISNGATVTLTGTDEDTTSSGTTVSTILTGASWADVDSGAVKGIAVTGKTGNGTWQYSTDGTTWASFGSVSSSSALLLTSGTQVRYVPDAANGETATFTFQAWDQTSGTASTNTTPGHADATVNGGTTAFSTSSATASMTITSVNDAPTISNGATVTLTGTDEDTTSSGTTVSTILTGASWADVDSGALKGIAVTSKSGNGTWQYSTDGTTWTAFGAVSSSSALLLDSGTQVRYIPDGNNGETATFGFVAWDQTTGTASTNGSPSTANPGSGGGTTAYSSQSATASMTITAVNDAPTLSNGATVTLTGTDEDTTSSGTTVSSILTSASYADVDTGASSGIAITGKTGNGTWQYSTNGTTWTAFGTVSSSSALLLTSTTQVRYIPDAHNGETATFTFVAWDQTTGTASTNGSPSTANPGSGGGTTAYSTGSATASITVTSVNDAPTITNGATATLTGTDEDTTSSGTTVSTILTAASWADVDTGAVKGIAVTAKTGNGTWQYSTDGTTWTAFGTVSSSSALLLDSGTQVRYIPDGNNGETATFTFKAWDKTTGSASTNGSPSTANPGSGGGTTAYSSNSASASMTVTSVNDAPTITNAAVVPLTSTDENTASNAFGANTTVGIAGWADVDTGALKGIAITGVTGNGTWQFSTDNVTWTSVGAVSSSNALLLAANSYFRYMPDSQNGETATMSFVAWDQTTGTASANGSPSYTNPGAGGGTSAFSSQSASSSITITSVNDAPTITNNATVILTGTDEDTTSSGTTVSSILTTASWADVDTGAVKGIAITSKVGNGTWQYSTDGTTWASFGAVSSSNALLLTSTTQVRYIPDGSNGETATFGFKAWDQTTGIASTNSTASYANAGAGGGSTAYSTGTGTASMTITSVNDAPSISNGATVTLSSTNEDTTSSGTTVSTILTGASWADVDTGASKGIAITGKAGNGTWQYSTDGTTWASFGTVTSSSALLLTSTTQVRYIPDGLNGETATFTFVAWDQTTGTASTNGTASYANPGSGGGTTAYSSQIATASMTVTSVNDAPTITNGATVTLTGTNEDTTSSGTTVSTILTGASWADVDNGALKGIAITSKSGNGTWQYSTDGTTWASFGAVSGTNALLLTSGTQVRYVPDGANGETATFGFKAWDQTSGTASTNSTPGYASTASSGGTTSFSSNSASASMTITSVNDAPTITNGATVTLTGTDEDTTSSGTTVNTILTGASWADVDTGASKGIAVTSKSGNGTWQYSTDGTTWANFGSVSSSSALVLTSTTQVRYIPDGLNGETATFGFVAWDQTTDTASTNSTPSYADSTTAGGTTAYSTQAATASMTITSVNDAPTISNGATVTLTGTDEDTTSSATTVNTILTGASWADVDTGASKGIAITGKTGNGTWQYSTDGTTWAAFGSVTGTHALLLTSTTQVRYIPDAANGETATFSFVAWDQTSGSASTNGTASYANPGSGGGTTAYSSQSATASMTISSVNDAPTITNGATVTLAGTDEDTTSSGTTVSSILTSASWADVDTGAVKGIAITSKSGNGTWQYSTDGTTWTAFGSVSASNALLLTSGTQVRYVPDGNNGETATFGFQAWDQTSDSASTNGAPSYADATVNGGTTAYSSQSATASMTISSVNDAPTITNGATVTLTGTNEDTTSSGTAVSSILTSASWADVDTGALKGIAITGKTGNGTWQYSTDGTTWAAFGSVTSSNALLLTSGTQVRYVPDGNNGETATFGFQAWDQTSDSASTNGAPSYADATVNGGTTAYSSQSATASMTISSVNDAPTITNGATVTLTGTNEDTTSSGTTVNSILTSASWADVDTGALKGIAITSKNGNGTWQYSTDGTTWAAFGSVTGTHALLLTSTTQVRYIPDAANGETATFSFVAWDQTSGSASTNGTASYANPGSGGGTSAYSSQSATASMTITSVNDAPTITNGATVTLTGTDEDTTSSATLVSSILTSASYADVDTGAVKGIAITSKSGNGTWQYSTDGTTWASFGSVSGSNALLLTSGTQVRYVPDGNNGETATFTFQAWDQTSDTASTNGTPSYGDTSTSGGTSAYSSQAATASMTISSVNDAPTITNGATVILTATDEDTTSSATLVSSILTSASYADVDTGAVKGIAITSKSGNGTWQYSTDGTTWASFGSVSGSNALLLTSGTQVRYIPDGMNGETATFTFQAWDQTSDTASTNSTPSYADSTTAGGTTAYSTQAATASMTITSVNDAPTISNGATVTLTGTNEDTTSSGTTVNSILTSASWADVDTGALKGIAITSKSGNGTWQYSTDGTTWASFGSVSGSNALLLTSGTQVRYIPDGMNGETATFTFQAWDQTSDTASTNSTPSYADSTTAGGTTAYSTQAATASMTITSVNDAPTISNGATVTLTGTDEDTTSSGTTVNSILTSASWADVDTGAVKGIAITSKSGNGTWQYSTDGTTWKSFGAVSSSSALLLSSATQIRYLPDAHNGETATFGFVAWDQTTGTASTNSTQNHANTSPNGGTTAFSAQSASASIIVSSLNDAPTVTNNALDIDTSTDLATTSDAVTVNTCLTDVSWADVDTGALKGLAVISTSGYGTWEFSTDGSTWTAFGAVSAGNALLLAPTAQVHYVPDGLHAETASFQFVAWDQTTGSASTSSTPSYVDSSARGGTNAFSSQTATTQLQVTIINRAPTITDGAVVSITGTDEDTTSPGTTVDSILNGADWADQDLNPSKGIAIDATTGNGTWQYSTDGTSWTNFGSVSSTNALLLDSGSQVRYIPDGLNGETATFSFQAWDQVTDTASSNGAPSYANPGVGGGVTSYSVEEASASMTITPVNDAPTISNGATSALTGTDEDTPSSGTAVSSILTDASWADVDTGAASGIAVTGVTGNGTWQYSTNGTTWTAFGSVSSSNALLLTSTTQVRYLPDGLNGESATFSYVAWDQTAGTASVTGSPGYADASIAGGTTAFSTESASASITVTSVNDAPTLSNGATVTLTGTNEDTTSSGTAISTVLTGASWNDVDAGAVKGMAITAVTGNGTWQYSTDGVTWTNFGAVSASNALLLTPTSQVHYIPDSLNGETATFTFQAWDQTTDSASTNSTPSYADASVNGGTTAYSTETATASITVTDVNDAPTISNGANVSLTGTDEDTASAGDTVSSILSGATWADVDTGAVSGVAVTSVTGNGTWQYSTDGTTWNNFGSVSASNALLLTSGTHVRYQPDALNGETATFTFQAWDQTSGSASTNSSASYADASVAGGTTAFSTEAATASIVVTSVNDAPTLSNGATVTITGTDEDTTSSGTTVSSILTGASWADVDTGAINGIAVTSVTGNGTWQYSTDGTTWTNFGSVSASNALLLTSSSQVRYTPDGLNAETATFSFQAWDRTTDSASTNGTPSYADASVNGGTTAYSTQSATASMTITAVNDAPTITNGATVTITGTDEDTTSPGTTVSSILTGASWADVDAGAVNGIAITGVTGNGTWQYSTDGTTWANFGTVSSSSALLLTSTSQVRYIPDALNGETATFSFVAWDQTSGTASTNTTPGHANTSPNGGTTAFSTASATASMTITSVNDAPTMNPGGSTIYLPTTDENTPSTPIDVNSILVSFSINDVDTGAFRGMAITGVTGNGTWQYSMDDVTWTDFGAVSGSNALLLNQNTDIRYMPDHNNGETASFTFVAWDQTTGTISANSAPSYANPSPTGGTTAYSTVSATAYIQVTSINSAPTITNSTAETLTGTTEDTTSTSTTVDSILTAASWADVDHGAAKGIAITGTTGHGTWQYSTDGSTWNNFGNCSTGSGLLLASGSQIRYVPDQANGETANFSFIAWDQTAGTASTNSTANYSDCTVCGGTTCFSTEAATCSVTTTDVNDAPTITSGATVTLTGTNEDTTSGGTTVSTILTGASWADVDTGAVKGIAVTSKTGNGTWQYSTDGTTWAAFGNVSASNALLLTSTTQVRYVPNGLNGETATFGFKAWDQTTGSASTNSTPSYANPGSGGTTTAYSSNSATASMTVTSVNDAPTITNGATVTLTGTDENTTSSGTMVNTILTSASWADVDTGALKGIAITGKTGHGTWQYSTDGTTWTAFGAVSSSNALLLTSGTQVRYVPDQMNGETATFNFVAWDQTSGTASTNSTPSYASPGAGGGTSAYSSQSASASIVVTSVNDAPTITNAATVNLTTTDEDTISTATSVNSILTTASWADVDTGALKGIAVTSATGHGTWQYSTDSATWNAFGSVSASHALVLNSTTLVRYIPDGKNGETANFTFIAWDQTSGAASTNSTANYANPGAAGGTSAYSTQSATALLNISSVNDAPTLVNGAQITLNPTDQNTISSATAIDTLLAGASWADVDNGALKGIAVTGTSGTGTWKYSTDGTTWTDFGSVSAGHALLLPSGAQIRYLPGNGDGELATLSFVAWDQTTGTASSASTPSYANSNSGGGTSAFSTQSALATLNVAGADGYAVSLIGTPLDPANQSPISYGKTLINNPVTRTFTVKNNRTSPLDISSITLPQGYTLTSGGPSTIGVGQSLDLTVAMDAASLGAKTGNIQLSTDDVANPTWQIPVDGKVQYGATIGAGSTPSLTFTDADGTIVTITLSGTGTAQLHLDGNGISSSVVKKLTKIAGTGISLDSLNVVGASGNTKLTITTKGGNGLVDVAALTSTAAMNSISAKTTRVTEALTIPSISNIDLYSITSTATATLGSFGNATIRNNFAAKLNSGSFKSLTVAGSITGSNITVTGDASKISVKSNISDSTILTSGSILSLTASALINSNIYAAAFPATGSLPLSADYKGSAQIKTLNVKTFQNSNIAAHTFGNINLGNVISNNGHVTEGVAAMTITSLTFKLNGKTVHLAKATTPALLLPQLVKANVNLQDFEIILADTVFSAVTLQGSGSSPH